MIEVEGTLEKVTMNKMKQNADGDMTHPEHAVITIKADIDTLTQRQAIAELATLLNNEEVSVAFDPRQGRLPLNEVKSASISFDPGGAENVAEQST